MLPKSIRIISSGMVIFVLSLFMPVAHADALSERETQSILHMLDYLSVDYGGAVLYGAVVNEREYREQTEFSGQSVKLLVKLPANPRQEALIKEAQELNRIVLDKGLADRVSALAQLLRKEIIAAYQVPVSPQHIPDYAHAGVLYKQLCVRCHGAEGYGNGVESEAHNPKPSNFHDATRMGKRSVYGLYNSISLGVARTAMPEFSQLSDDERWSLAFFVSNLHNPPERLKQGRELWEKRDFQGAAPDLLMLTTLAANEVSVNYGDNARAVFEYLRAEPQALGTARRATLIFAGEQLDQALIRYRAGDQVEAQRLAIEAYLEGFEPMEIGLANLDSQLRLDIEQEMTSVRQLIYGGSPTEAVLMKIERAKGLLRQADELLRGGKLTITGAFASSLSIMLKKGLVVVLMLPVILAFVMRSERRSGALGYIHAGWSAALLLGVLTWGVAAWLMNIPGSSRATTSGITVLMAAAVLVYAWFWLNGKTHTRAWQQFLKDSVGIVLEKKALRALAMIAFLVVYREIFEAALFYQALWTQTSDITRTALWSGALAAGMILLVGCWVALRICIRLQPRVFFGGTSILFAAMAVIFSGQGVASLQEAGIVSAHPVHFISLPVLGILPTTQTLMAQLLAIGILILCFLVPIWQQRGHHDNQPPASQV
ncbi:MAG: FTR1 family protein [Nitrosomonadales bacterium]|nr:FTR1 family protein [Nitrosomonadales bacterium]